MQPPQEFIVYLRMLEYLVANKWTIICACPPAGTDNRFRKCLLPRRSLGDGQKGPRDEVDIIAHNDEIILLIECKATLLHSMTRLNALQESDYQKLLRIKQSVRPKELATLLSRGTGISVPLNPIISIALAVQIIDYNIPEDITTFEIIPNGVKVWP